MTRVVLAALLVAQIAHADERADALYREGEQLYLAKQYLGAATKFEASYALDPAPAVLFNIAQAYRLGRACAQAARFYHQFLDRVPSPPERDKLDRYLVEMDACAKAEAAATPPTVIHDVVHDTRIVRETRVVTRHKTLVPGIVVGSIGVVALGLGAYFTHGVHAAEDARSHTCLEQGCPWSTALPAIQHQDDRGRRAEIGEAVSYGVGIGALVTGAVLIVVGRGERVEPVVAPSPGGATIGAALRW